MSGAAASRDLADRAGAAAGRLPGSADRPVQQIGVVQALHIPPGLSVVRFTYTAPGLSRGLTVTSATAGVVLLALCGALAARLRRRRALGRGA